MNINVLVRSVGRSVGRSCIPFQHLGIFELVDPPLVGSSDEKFAKCFFIRVYAGMTKIGKVKM